MHEKTVVPTTASGPSSGFHFREDFLLFGLLVRHGLCEPGDYLHLVEAQRRGQPLLPLMEILCTTSALGDKSRRDMQELLDILATPKLRDLLPSEMPEVRTLVDSIAATAVEPTRDDPTEVFSASAAQTIVDGVSVSSSSTQQLPSYSHLSEPEIRQVEKARPKGRLIGEILAGHVLLDRLGSGGQGDVYLAKQLSLDRYVALKKLEAPPHTSPQQFIEAFRREAQTLGRINHARIVKVFEIFAEGGNVFFTMERVTGKTLKELVPSGGSPLPLDVVANIACQACSALARTAEDNLVHRDIKPANMMLDDNGDLKIVDFGLAGAAAHLGDQTSFSGTPQFASPEQAKLQSLTPASDQYSLGLTLYYVLTGEIPFKAAKLGDLLEMHISAVPKPPSELNEQLPRAVDRVILRMLEKDPAKRFPTFNKCFAEWERILRDSRRESTAAAPQLLGETLLRFSREEQGAIKKRGMYLALAWLLVVIGTVAGEASLRRNGLAVVLEKTGDYGTYLLTFSLACIFYVALARRRWLPLVGTLRGWLYTHIITVIPAVIMLLIHSGNFMRGFGSAPMITILMSTILLITAISGSVGLLIFRGLQRQVHMQQLQLRGTASERQAMATVLSARLLSGWRLVHYPLAIFFIMLSILHIIQSIKFGL